MKFLNVKHFEIKSLSLNVQSQNPKKQIFNDEKIQKAYKNLKLSSKKKFLRDLVINQVNLLVLWQCCDYSAQTDV